MHRPLIAAAVLALAAQPGAAETRQLDAHVHGHGALDIAVEGTQVAMALEVPGADIVGFEHPAESAEDKAAVEAGIEALSRPLELFVLPGAAGCTVTEAAARLVGDEHHDDHAEAGHDDHGHGDDHAEAGHDDHGHGDDHAAEAGHDDHGHGDDHAAEAGHDDHGHGDEQAEAGHDDHGHGDEHASEASHSEFRADYVLTCADPSAIDRIAFAYFARFANAEALDVRLVTDKGAEAFEVGRDAPELSLGGAI